MFGLWSKHKVRTDSIDNVLSVVVYPALRTATKLPKDELINCQELLSNHYLADIQNLLNDEQTQLSLPLIVFNEYKFGSYQLGKEYQAAIQDLEYAILGCAENPWVREIKDVVKRWEHLEDRIAKYQTDEVAKLTLKLAREAFMQVVEPYIEKIVFVLHEHCLDKLAQYHKV